MNLKKILKETALSEAEYQLILQKLGREPNLVELGMFGSLWSEHCGYKHSKALLKKLPRKAPQVLIGPGKENAGAVAVGDGLVAVFKMESHNHPSAIEPFQGAATGIGGIVRDIFTMGARPIALMNSLRFGPLNEPKNRYLFNGVVGGISWYGNCLGIPNVGGEVFFSPAYSLNPLVNVLCLGLAAEDKLVRACARGEGNLLMLVGAETGRDGIYGASGLASQSFDRERELRAAVQVGNPFMEKLLIEACLELAEKKLLIGMQDLGAAGLTAACIEAAARGGSGIELDVLSVPRREEGMSPYEVMLSESQERMLLILKPELLAQVQEVVDRWELPWAIIGQVTSDGQATIKEGDKVVAELPIELLTHPPLYVKKTNKPLWLRKLQRHPLPADLFPRDCSEVLLRLLGSPNIASKEPVFRQYDFQVGINTVIGPGEDAALLRLPGTRKALALSCDGNGRLCYLDPFIGGALAVAEAARNVVCLGADPLALTNCLNLGNPEKPDIYYQLKEVIRGIAYACSQLNIPVVSGNVSLYNETEGKPIYPTPVVGMLGLMEDIEKRVTGGFRAPGDRVFLLGELGGFLAGSEFMELIHGQVAGKPRLDMEKEKEVQRVCLESIRRGIISSAHDLSEGGLGVALAECAIKSGLGFMGVQVNWGGRIDELLFGEGGARIIVSAKPENAPLLEELAKAYGVPLTFLGTVGGERFFIPGLIDLPLSRLALSWHGWMDRKGCPCPR